MLFSLRLCRKMVEQFSQCLREKIDRLESSQRYFYAFRRSRRKLVRERNPQYSTIYDRSYTKRSEFRVVGEESFWCSYAGLRHSCAQTMTHIRGSSAKLKWEIADEMNVAHLFTLWTMWYLKLYWIEIQIIDFQTWSFNDMIRVNVEDIRWTVI